MAFRRGWGGELSIPRPKGGIYRYIYERLGLLLIEVNERVKKTCHFSL